MPYLDDDIVDFVGTDGKPWQYYWGDEVEVLGQDERRLHVRVIGIKGPVAEGFISAKAKLREAGILRLSMVDVQQGDGLILDTPRKKVVFIDGGDNQLFARHAAARYRNTSAEDPLVVDAVVTHGDADHFAGLNLIGKSEDHQEERKRLFMTARRVYHNGLAKRPTKQGGRDLDDLEMFGGTASRDGREYVTELVDDPSVVADQDLNKPFRDWKGTLATWRERLADRTGEQMEVRRIDQHAGNAFDFLADEGVHVEVLGPITEKVNGRTALAFLTAPPSDSDLMLGTRPLETSTSWSASHTVNGHSISFRMRYGNVRFLMTGDLNEESMRRLRGALPDRALRAEILKTPHHGSSDFNHAFLEEVSPVVSLISSGDESEQKEHIHPRATLMSALGKASRTTPGIVFCTELAAFFSMRGYVTDPGGRKFFAFERTNFGIAHIRTDGERVLAFTHSGKKGTNEAYRFTVSPTGEVEFARKVTKVTAPRAR
jgi:beta-lactamase superfamily II metal-dependent hydrolase